MRYRPQACEASSEVDITSYVSPQIITNLKNLRGFSVAIPPDIYAKVKSAIGGDVPQLNQGTAAKDAASNVIGTTGLNHLWDGVNGFFSYISMPTLWKGIFLLIVGGVLIFIGVKLLK
jgi:hypothetical protein